MNCVLLMLNAIITVLATGKLPVSYANRELVSVISNLFPENLI